METVAIPQVIKIAQPRLWNLMRSVGQRSRISGLAPESADKEVARPQPLPSRYFLVLRHLVRL